IQGALAPVRLEVDQDARPLDDGRALLRQGVALVESADPVQVEPFRQVDAESGDPVVLDAYLEQLPRDDEPLPSTLHGVVDVFVQRDANVGRFTSVGVGQLPPGPEQLAFGLLPVGGSDHDAPVQN
ncbi:MAG: hypothetical protein ACK55I_29270, partial [bacterium]